MATYGHITPKINHIPLSNHKAKLNQIQKFKTSKPSYFNTSLPNALLKEMNKKLSLDQTQNSKTIEISTTPLSVRPKIKVASVINKSKVVKHKKSISVVEPKPKINYDKFINVNKRPVSSAKKKTKQLTLTSKQSKNKINTTSPFNTINASRVSTTRHIHNPSSTISSVKRDMTPVNKTHRVIKTSTNISTPCNKTMNNSSKKFFSTISTPKSKKLFNVSSRNTSNNKTPKKISVSQTPVKSKVFSNNKNNKITRYQSKTINVKKSSKNQIKIVPFKSKGNFNTNNIYGNNTINGFRNNNNTLFKTKPKTKSVFNTPLSFLNNNTFTLDKQNHTSIIDDSNYNSNKTTSANNQKNNIKSNSSLSSLMPKIAKIEAFTTPGYANGKKKINQDNYFIDKNFFNIPSSYLLGVCDGHGAFGHLCSEYIALNLPKKITSNYKSYYLSQSKEQILTKVFTSFNQELTKNKNIDTILSGSTCNTILFLDNTITCANVGDSRAVLCRYIDNEYKAIDLSRDHNPNEKDESERVTSKGGHILQYYDKIMKRFIGPKRIWLKNSDIPGLAMSRSFGDEIGHTVGIIATPEVREFKLEGNEKFMIIASDGVWEFISSQQCVDIIKEYYEKGDAEGGVDAIVKESVKRWRNEEETIDDITAIVVFFE